MQWGNIPVVCHVRRHAVGARFRGCGLVRMLAQAVNDVLLMFLYIGVELYTTEVHIQISDQCGKVFIGKV